MTSSAAFSTFYFLNLLLTSLCNKVLDIEMAKRHSLDDQNTFVSKQTCVQHDWVLSQF